MQERTKFPLKQSFTVGEMSQENMSYRIPQQGEDLHLDWALWITVSPNCALNMAALSNGAVTPVTKLSYGSIIILSFPVLRSLYFLRN